MNRLPRSPFAMSHQRLYEIVTQVQALLWFDLDEDGNDAWNRDKEWDVGLIEAVASVLIKADLRPTEGLPAFQTVKRAESSNPPYPGLVMNDPDAGL